MKFGVIGTNHITDRLLSAASHIDEFELVAVYSRTMERACEYAKIYNAPLVFDDLDKFAGCEEIDAVYIASPNSFHKSHSIKMLEAGKHVLCEKPIASNSAEFEEMMKVAKKKNLVLLEAMKPAFFPTIKLIRDNIKKIAPIRRGTFIYCQYSSRYDKYKEGIIENAFNPVLSNGALMDIGCYCIHNMLYFMGTPKKILSKSVMLHNGIDGEGTILAKYDGMLAEVIYSKISNSVLPSEIQGERGSILIDKVGLHKKITLHEKNGEVTDLSLEIMDDDMYYELEEFIRLAKTGESYLEFENYTRDAMKILDEARQQTGLVFPSDYVRPQK